MSVDDGTLKRKDLKRVFVTDVNVGDYMIIYGAVKELTYSDMGNTVHFTFSDSNLKAKFQRDETVMVIG